MKCSTFWVWPTLNNALKQIEIILIIIKPPRYYLKPLLVIMSRVCLIREDFQARVQ